jgi:hypothetical protein
VSEQNAFSDYGIWKYSHVRLAHQFFFLSCCTHANVQFEKNKVFPSITFISLSDSDRGTRCDSGTFNSSHFLVLSRLLLSIPISICKQWKCVLLYFQNFDKTIKFEIYWLNIYWVNRIIWVIRFHLPYAIRWYAQEVDDDLLFDIGIEVISINF